jgi:hypothetical protein
MPNVLTTQSTVSCGLLGVALPNTHQGTVRVQSMAKLKVAGASVLLKASIENMTITDCKTPVPPHNSPCQLVSAVSDGESTKLKVDGNPVILETLKGSTNGIVTDVTPQKLLAGVASLDKLSSV